MVIKRINLSLDWFQLFLFVHCQKLYFPRTNTTQSKKKSQCPICFNDFNAKFLSFSLNNIGENRFGCDNNFYVM